MHMCMPSGDAMRHRFSELMEVMKADNRAVIRAMLDDGMDVPDTVAELGLRYVPAQHRLDAHGQPIMDVYGLRDLVAMGTFSCGDAASLEAAVLEEKYGMPAVCLAVAQGDDDLHGVFATSDGIVDPVANYLTGTRWKAPRRRRALPAYSCEIKDGRVVCVEPDVCAVDERGVWHCPEVPGLTGRRESIETIEQSDNGQLWARTKGGAVVPVTRRGRR